MHLAYKPLHGHIALTLLSAVIRASVKPAITMKFRPCIDIHDGVVKQIVGGTLKDAPAGAAEVPTTNFVAKHPADHFARMYAADSLNGGHVILLGKGDVNEVAALSALSAFPGGLQVGGGMTPANAKKYLDAGASHVIVTSYVFRDGTVDYQRLQELVDTVGKERLVLDLSCRKRRKTGSASAGAGGAARQGTGAAEAAQAAQATGAAAAEAQAQDYEYVVVTDRWQKWTDTVVDASTLQRLSAFCSEFLVHGVDVEGLRAGVEDGLVELLGRHSPIPVTYAGGVRDMADVHRVASLGQGRVDVSIGSALDIFGGSFPYDTIVQWHREQQQPGAAGGAGATAVAGGSGHSSSGSSSGQGAQGVQGPVVQHDPSLRVFYVPASAGAGPEDPQTARLTYELLSGAAAGSGSASTATAGATAATGSTVMDMTHTIVPEAHRGRGVAGHLATAAFTTAQAQAWRVRPSCSYIRETFVPKNPQYKALLE